MLTGRYGEGAPESILLDVPGGTAVTCSRLPAIVGDAVLAVEPLRHAQSNAAVGGIWRVRGTDGSAVLKLATPPAPETATAAWPASDEPAHWNYWRRETLASSSQLAAAAYRDTIAAPALLEANLRADGGVELWLADVSRVVAGRRRSSCGWPTSVELWLADVSRAVAGRRQRRRRIRLAGSAAGPVRLRAGSRARVLGRAGAGHPVAVPPLAGAVPGRGA